MRTHLTRRRFLERALATTAACGLAQLSDADESSPLSPAPAPIIDTHVYLGHWPHERIPADEPTELVAMLRRNQVSQAWAGSFDGLFYKDIGGVNQRLAETCAEHGDGRLVPFGTVNPTLPDCEEDLRRCHETFHMPGIRVHPTYHGYTLDDPRFARLLELAAARGLVVQLVAWLEDKKHLWLNPRAAEVDLKPLAKIVAGLPNLRLVVANGFRTVDDAALVSLAPLKQVYFDFARLDDGNQLCTMVEQLSADRIVFGSAAPLHDFESARSRLEECRLKDGHLRAIASKTASALVSIR